MGRLALAGLLLALAACGGGGSPPPAPQAVAVAAATATAITVAWETSPGATGYRVERALEEDDFAELARVGPKDTRYVDARITPTAWYRYRIVADNGYKSQPSLEVKAGAPPRGFGTVVTADVGGGAYALGRHVSLAHDEAGDPLAAWVEDDPNRDGDLGDSRLQFARWLRREWRWSLPVTVKAGLGQREDAAPQRQVSLARDATRGTVGVAFQVREKFCTGAADDFTVFLALSGDKGVSWLAPERVSEAKYTRDATQGVEACNASNPSLALANGEVHLAWWVEAGKAFPVSAGLVRFQAGVAYASRLGGGAWRRELMPIPDAERARPALDLALDSAGAPGVVAATLPESASPPQSFNTSVRFWRPGQAATAVVLDSQDTQNDGPGVALAFSGAWPRVAAWLARGGAAGAWFAKSTDGATFEAPALLPRDGEDSGQGYLALAVSPLGALTVVHDWASSGAGGSCGGPKLVTSPDGVSWTACGPGPDRTVGFLGDHVTAAELDGAGLSLAFKAEDKTGVGGAKAGVWYWRQPRPVQAP